MPKIAKNCQRMSLPEQLPAKKDFVAGIRRAPDRGFSLTVAQTKTALKNALRYIPAPLAAGNRPRVFRRIAQPRPDLRLSLPARGLSEGQSR